MGLVGSRFGSTDGTVWAGSMTPNQVASASTVVAPAQTVYGPGGAAVVPAGKGGSGIRATWLSIGALVALVFIRQSLPKSRR